MEAVNVMNRRKVADTIHQFLEAGLELVGKPKFTPDDHSRVKILRTMSPHIAAAVMMIQQETQQQKLVLVQERMKQLGYGGEDPKQLGQ